MKATNDLASRLVEDWQGHPLTDDEAHDLAASSNILTLGMLADEARRRIHGRETTFVRVADVPAEPGAPLVWPSAAGEVRIVGTPVGRAAALARVHEAADKAGGTPLSGFSLVDLETLAASEAITLRALLEALCEAGLELVAEAPVDRLQDPRRSLEEVNIAGLSLARLTVSSVESPDAASTVAQFRQVAALQHAVGFIRSFAPLPRRISTIAPSTGYEDIKRVALARLLVNNIKTIQVDWNLYGPKLAQVALTVGADDLDAVSPEEEVSAGRRRAPLAEVRTNIEAAGQVAVERNGRYDVLAPGARV